MNRAENYIPDSELFINRELSWLEFNSRVLEEASNPFHPLLERLKFLAIFGNNLDEFFMIHVPGMRDRSIAEGGFHPSERLLSASLIAIQNKLAPILSRFADCFREVFALLDEYEIRLMRFSDLNEAQQERMRVYYESEIHPILTPLSVDPSHPFPYISNLSISLAVLVYDPLTGQEYFARVKVPSKKGHPRLIPVAGHQHSYILLEELMTPFIGRLFTGMEIRGCYPFRVTRNADFELQDDVNGDLREIIEEKLQERRFGEVVRVEIANSMPEPIQRRLMEELEVRDEEVYSADGPLNPADFFEIANLDMPELRDVPFVPAVPARLREDQEMFAAIRQGDILLHHPYQSFGCVTDFLRHAANDPNVLAIKHTLYRTSGDSPILEALSEAAEAQKQVAVLVELKARFDEENNITWAKQLEKSGVHVVFGVPGLKTHCKVTLVVRREPDGLRRYLHVGTGNYNPKTARTYTDVGILTCDTNFGADATDLFNYLTGNSRQTQYRKFLVAPVTLRSSLQAMIERESEKHSEEHPGHIIAKMNGLVDFPLIRALYAASQKGVNIELIVRGMCCLRPGVPGLSENITVVSIVGRFLEHSRIFYFQNGGDQEVYIGSADWMSRNLDRRVEVVVPVESSELRHELIENVLKLYLRDNTQAWDLQPDGSYVRRHASADELEIASQSLLLARLTGIKINNTGNQ